MPRFTSQDRKGGLSKHKPVLLSVSALLIVETPKSPRRWKISELACWKMLSRYMCRVRYLEGESSEGFRKDNNNNDNCWRIAGSSDCHGLG